MERFTVTHARGAAARVRAALGAPDVEWSPRESGKGNRCNVGAVGLHIGSSVNGVAWRIYRTVTDTGAESDIVTGRTPADLVSSANDWIEGFYWGQRAAAPVLAAVLDRLAAHNWRPNEDEVPVFDAARAFVATHSRGA